MKGLDLLMDLGKVSKTEHKVNNEHVPSTIQPDTLFTFTRGLSMFRMNMEI